MLSRHEYVVFIFSDPFSPVRRGFVGQSFINTVFMEMVTVEVPGDATMYHVPQNHVFKPFAPSVSRFVEYMPCRVFDRGCLRNGSFMKYELDSQPADAAAGEPRELGRVRFFHTYGQALHKPDEIYPCVDHERMRLDSITLHTTLESDRKLAYPFILPTLIGGELGAVHVLVSIIAEYLTAIETDRSKRPAARLIADADSNSASASDSTDTAIVPRPRKNRRRK